jgi:type I restriction-modification system DNA methylase subunit
VGSFQDKINFIWSVADEILRDDFQRKDYQDVILPFTVLRRIDCVLESTKDQVRDRYKRLKEQGLRTLTEPCVESQDISITMSRPTPSPAYLRILKM